MQYSLFDYFGKLIRLIESVVARPVEFFNHVRKHPVDHGALRMHLPVGAVLRGLLIALPIVAIFAALLASADLVFNQKLAEFLNLFDFENVSETILHLIIILITAYILAGVV